MNKFFVSSLAAVLFAVTNLAVSTESAHAAQKVAGCVLITKKDSHTSGRFIWKPTGAHFPGQGVIVAPRYYYLNSITVTLLDSTGTKFETARLKSTGVCSNNECLHAATFLTPHNGGWYKRHKGSIYVRIAPSSAASHLSCRSYFIEKPAGRAEFQG
jgi:hypothetical protein